MSNDFSRHFRPRVSRSSSTPEQAVRINLLSALLFGGLWWIPTDWFLVTHDLPAMTLVLGFLSGALITFCIGSVWFFLVSILAGGIEIALLDELENRDHAHETDQRINERDIEEVGAP